MSTSFKIVVPTDFSEGSLAALEWVKKISDEKSAEVHCINVVHQPMVYMPMMSAVPAESIPSADQLSQVSKESLDIFVEQHVSTLGIKPVTKVLVGRPATEIADYAKEIGADMIIIATRGHSRLAHAMLGSTAEGVLSQAECAVLSVHG